MAVGLFLRVTFQILEIDAYQGAGGENAHHETEPTQPIDDRGRSPMKLQPRYLHALLLSALLSVGIHAHSASATTAVTAPALTPPELAEAAEDFRTYCSVCHGRNGKGRGPVASELKTPPADLTIISDRAGGSFPAETVYKKVEGLDMPLAHGTTEMPIWGALFVRQAVGEGVLIEDAKTAARVATDRIRRLVKYLETIQE